MYNLLSTQSPLYLFIYLLGCSNTMQSNEANDSELSEWFERNQLDSNSGRVVVRHILLLSQKRNANETAVNLFTFGPSL